MLVYHQTVNRQTVTDVSAPSQAYPHGADTPDGGKVGVKGKPGFFIFFFVFLLPIDATCASTHT